MVNVNILEAQRNNRSIQQIDKKDILKQENVMLIVTMILFLGLIGLIFGFILTIRLQ